MSTDFDKWNSKKKQLATRTNAPTFKEREVWWCSLGHNIGIEQNGKGKNFTRPILVLRKFSNDQLIGIPSTRSTKTSRFYHLIQTEQASFNFILSQARVIDSKRLTYKLVTIPKNDFEDLKASFKKLYGLGDET